MALILVLLCTPSHSVRCCRSCKDRRVISFSGAARGDGVISNALERTQSIMAGTALRGLEGHLRHAAVMDANRRQDPPRANALAQSFLARRSLCLATRPDYVVHPLRRTDLPARF